MTDRPGIGDAWYVTARDPATAERTARLRELAAPPDWLVRIFRPTPAPIPWEAAGRAAIALTAPAALGLATGHVAPGLIGSIGALCATNADRGGPYRLRAFRVGFAVLFGATGFLIGGLAHGRGVVTLVALVAVGVVSALLSAIGAVTSTASLQLIVFASVGSGLSLGLPVWLPPGAFLAGGTWALALTLTGLLYKPRTPVRLTVSEVYRTLAGMLAAVGQPWVEQARQELTTALNNAYDTMLAARSRSGGRDPEFRRLMALLNEATPAIEASLLLVRESRQLPREVPRAVAAIADAVLGSGPPPRLPELESRGLETGEPGVYAGLSALRAGLEPVTALLAGRDVGGGYGPPHRPRQSERFREVWTRMISGPETLQWAARLGLCIAVAEAVPFVVPIDRSYWVVLTVAIVLKPDFGSVFARALQRAIGTVVGVLLGAMVLAGIPWTPVHLVFVAVFAAMLPIGLRRNFAIFSAFLTPVIILLIGLTGPGDWQLVLSRLVDTLVGCAIVLTVGYLIWPGTSQPRVGEHFADTVDDVSGYLRRAFTHDPKGRAMRRRRAYRSLSDLRTVFQQALTEPPPASRQAAAWWPAIVALERVTDAIAAAIIHTGGPGSGPSEEGAEQLAQAMDDLAEAVRRGRAPASLPLPEEEALAGITAEVHTARSVFTGPRVKG